MKNRLIKSVIFFCFTLISSHVWSKDIKIVFSQYTPPYVFENGNGIVIDIVRAALEPAGYKLVPVYVPIGRAYKMFADKQVDGTAIINEESGLKANYSVDFMQYHNYAFALKSKKMGIKGLSDLKGKNIIAFQEANKFLGEEFGRVVSGNPNYKELALQESQTLMLLLDRTDLAVMDESIFRFYREKLISEGKVPRSTEVDSFNIFPPTPYKTAFVDTKVRDDFNKGLETIRKDGQYDAIYRKYIDQYFEIKK